MDLKQPTRMHDQISRPNGSATSQNITERYRTLPAKTRKGGWLVLAVLVVLLVGAFAWTNLAGPRPNGGRYQALFLNNGQVFFGKLKNVNGKYLTLDNAYYSKSQELPANATAEQKAATSSNVSLVKVGQEVYGPENKMQIRADQVLFWQDLKSDSKVAKAIDSAK